MTKRRTLLLVVLGLLGAVASAQSPTGPRPASTQRYPQFENAQVRVWKTVVMPHQPSDLHRHDHARTVVALVGGPLTIRKQSGSSQVMRWETGKAYWLEADPPGELHADVNDTDKPIEVMTIEMTR